MKTKTTEKLEDLLQKHFNPLWEFYCFECTYGWHGKEIVDCISYDSSREVSCFEIKQSIGDFHSKAKVSFFGNKNYYVMTRELYEELKEEIPREIGVYVPGEFGGYEILTCIKQCERQELKADKEVILSSMLRCACRDRDRMSCFGRGDYTNDM